MKDVRESQNYFDFGQRLRFIAASAAINIYRFAPRLLRYDGISRVRETGKLLCTPRTFPRRKIWNAARISELKLESTFSGPRGGSAEKIRGIIHSVTRSHSGSGIRMLRFNRFRSFPPEHVAYLRTIERTLDRRERGMTFRLRLDDRGEDEPLFVPPSIFFLWKYFVATYRRDLFISLCTL